MRQCSQAVYNIELQGDECLLQAAVNVNSGPASSGSGRDRSGQKMGVGVRGMMKSGGRDGHLPPAYAGREPKSIMTQKAEEGGDFKKEGKKGGVKAAKEPRTTILD